VILSTQLGILLKFSGAEDESAVLYKLKMRAQFCTSGLVVIQVLVVLSNIYTAKAYGMCNFKANYDTG
jgi:hypothetical protein